MVSKNQELQSIIGSPINMGSKRTYSSQGTKSTHKSENFVYTVVGERGFGLVDAQAETTKQFETLTIGNNTIIIHLRDLSIVFFLSRVSLRQI